MKDSSFGPDGEVILCPSTSDQIPGDRQSCEYPLYCWEFRNHTTKAGDCLNCQNIGSGVYHFGGCWRPNTVGGCSEQTSGGPTITFYYPNSQCGDASPCTTQWVQDHCKAPRTYVPPGN